MTNNHPTGQNPTPAHITAAALALTVYAAFTLTPEQAEHLLAILGIPGAISGVLVHSRRPS
ncbi:hypothetical protein [Streptomyces californicus]|uniref:hypothetical protein n=1 Tax=Streptomyces californicus TaxID=67351 RepID=UPI0036862238